MSRSDFPGHAMDRNLLADFGVQQKTSCQYVIPQGDDSDDFRSPNENLPKKNKTDGMLGETDNNKPVVCSVVSSGPKQRSSQYFALCLGVVLFVGLCGYVIHIDIKHSEELADLRQELKQLADRCSAARQSSGNSDSDVPEESFADTRNSDDAKRRSHLRFDSTADLPEDDDSEELGTFLGKDWNQVGRRWTQEDDDDVEADDDVTAVDVISDDNNDGGRAEDEKKTVAGQRLLSRVRRDADSKTTAKPNKKRHKGKGKKRGTCRRYNKCKTAKAKGKKPNKKCREIFDCVERSAQSSGGELSNQCKRVMACIQSETPLPKTSKSTQPAPFTSFIPKAVHFYSDFWNNRRQQEFGKETPLKFLQGADWMSKMYKDQSEQPIQQTNDGGFIVNQTGLYLIYSSVMYHDLKPRQSMAVVVNGQKLFKCMDSVDYVDTDMPAENNQAKYKTCAMTGVTHLEQGDRLEVQNLYENTEIDLSTDATYFGAVLFSPGAVKAS